MATGKSAPEFKKGDRVKVASGDWGAGNRGTVDSVKGSTVSVLLDGPKEIKAFAAAAVRAVEAA